MLLIAVVLLCISSAGTGACIALGLATADLANGGLWARDFAKSPGPAALVALIAACVAFAGLSMQVDVSRAALAHQRAAARGESWWAMFEWASGRAVPLVRNDQSLPDEITVSTLQRLPEDATTEVQQTACKGMIDFLVTRLPSEGAPSGTDSDEGELPESQSTIITPLEQYVDATAGTAAASALAEALVYKNNVSKALMWFSFGSANLKVLRNPLDRGSDAILLVDDRKVLVIIKRVSEPRQVRSVIRRSVEQLRRHSDDSPILVVTPFSSPLQVEEEVGLGAVAVQWRNPNDGDALLAAARRASMLSEGYTPGSGGLDESDSAM